MTRPPAEDRRKQILEKGITKWQGTGGGWEVSQMAEFIEELIAERTLVAPPAAEDRRSALHPLVENWRELAKIERVGAATHDAARSPGWLVNEHRRIAHELEDCANQLEAALLADGPVHVEDRRAALHQLEIMLRDIRDIGGCRREPCGVHERPQWTCAFCLCNMLEPLAAALLADGGGPQEGTMRNALEKLANEASGFLAMAETETHGRTNMTVLQLRIDEARLALMGAVGGGRAQPEPLMLNSYGRRCYDAGRASAFQEVAVQWLNLPTPPAVGGGAVPPQEQPE